MKKTYALLFLLLSLNCWAQFSKTHYIPPLSGSNNSSSSAEDQFLYISTPTVTPVNFTIRELGGNTISGTVSKSTPYIYNVGFGTNTQLHVEKSLVNTVLSNKGYIIEAEDLIYVSARVTAGNGNQAGKIVSKGLAALGTQFRIGSFLNTAANPYTDNHYTFVSILATENNTVVQFSDIKPGVQLINNAGAGNTPAPVTLNSGESFVMAVEGPLDANRDGLIGSLVSSDKPIVVNCGSFTGSNATTNLDLGFDQIVSAERTGTEYIFIKSTGQAPVERVLLIAHSPNTEVRLNGNTGAYDYLLVNAGDYIALDGNNFDAQGNLYVHTTNNVFAYQSVGDNVRTDFANQELFFVPPLSCETPHIIDNIPQVDQIGTRVFTGRATLITESGSTVTFEINGTPYTLASLSSLPGVSVVGPTIVPTATQNYDTYTIIGLTGNFSAFSTSQLYLAAYGSNGAATFGGFYSGFTFKPEISFGLINVTQTNCIPNTQLSVNSLSPFDVFQWYFNQIPIPGATSSTYNPLLPGYYYVKATIFSCGSTLISDQIPVSVCPSNADNDLANDNIDLDHDNDGISDCMESLGNQGIDLSSATNLNITTSGPNTPSPNPFSGYALGDFVTATPIGKNNMVSFTKTFSQPTNISLEYVTTAIASNLLNSDGQFIVKCDSDKTITVLNPTNQLLIDTNYDGIYESGVTKYSSFEIRFRLNSTTPLAAGTGTFKFKSYATTSFSFSHSNLSDASPNNATFKLIATCVPRDTDGDGIPDALDLDSDNDGIPDHIEALGLNNIAYSNVDANADGLDDAFGIGILPADTDGDGVYNFIDLDSDNDGIYDVVEASSTAADSNLDGIIDGNPLAFGSNGLFDAIETFPDSAQLNYTIADTNTDGIPNYLSLDSDGDGCNDVIEADLLDHNGDGILGSGTPTVNANGLVTNATGYTVLPTNNYIIYAPISIITQPTIEPTCAYQYTTVSIVSTPVDSYHWQVLIGGVWTPIVDNANYSQSNTSTLHINNPPFSFNGLRYSVILQKNGNSCNLVSSAAVLTVYDVPSVTSPVTLIQCDDDTDGVTTINLKQKESEIAALPNRTFTYYTTLIGAQTGNETSTSFIPNPTNYYSNSTTVWVRILDSTHGCFNVAELDVTVTATQIPNSFQKKFYKCDDFLDRDGNNTINNNDRDGIAAFDFSSVTADIAALLPLTATYSINYYKNFQDASMETDANGNSLAISQNASDPISIYNYRNKEYPNQQQIWIRVESTADNSCYGLGGYITLYVEPLPVATSYNGTNIIRHCDDDQDGSYAFDTSLIHPVILNGQSNVVITYFDNAGNPLPSPLPNPFSVNTSTTVTVRVTNTVTQASDGPCYAEETLQFIVDVLPQVFPVNPNLLQICDDEIDPLLQDGKYAFDTSTFEATILNGQTGLTVEYYDGNTHALPSPLPNPFVTGTQNVTVIVTNPINKTCPATLLLPFVVHPTPKINLLGDELVCTNQPSFFKTLYADLVDNSSHSNYSYQWYFNGVSIPGATTYSIDINTAGTYSVDVTTIPFGCAKTRTITVVSSDIAHLDNIIISDLTESATHNTVQIIASGTGDLVYGLDSDTDLQPSNLFTDVEAGVHEVYIKDTNGCGIVGPIEIYVLGIPNFFSPNTDGFNDTWNIKGINDRFNKNSTIYIFDRHGKLLKEMAPTGKGWDGTYNGRQLPADDYWYSIKLEDNRVFEGHFSLIR